MTNESIRLVKVERVDDLPVLFGVLRQVGIAELLDEFFPTHHNWHDGLSFGQVVEGWMIYILSQGDHRLNKVEAFVEQHLSVYEASFGRPVRALDFSDDRLADVLERLAREPGWGEFESALNQKTLRVYDLGVERVRLDSTTTYSYQAVSEEGLLQLGFSKDRRPDLGQVKISLASLDPLGMPLMTAVLSGQSADEPLYVPAIKRVQESVGHGGKLYVGDAKMGTLATRAWLASSRDFYLCPLSGSQMAQTLFEALVEPALVGEVSLEEVFQPAASTEEAKELLGVGYRTRRRLRSAVAGRAIEWEESLYVVRSESYARSEKERLEKRLLRAGAEIEKLNERRQGKKRLSEIELKEAAQAVLRKHHCGELLEVSVEVKESRKAVRKYQARVAEERIEREIKISVERDEQAIKRKKQYSGWRVYGSNKKDLELSAAVLSYREQYQIEHSISRLKGRRLGMQPLYLQKEERITGLIHLLTLCVRELTLLEFVVRRELANQDEQLKGIYSSQRGRQTRRPSAELILEAFCGISVTTVEVAGKQKRLLSELNEVQQRLLMLLNLPKSVYESLSCDFINPVPL
ncbi:MAG: IS1634 family transposase [Acidobacteria bacterium]|nr:IS1634 family transposase [Acidobacteriota bacterium]